MTKRINGPANVGVAVLGFVLATAVPPSRALQPEPQMMFEMGAGNGAAAAAGLVGAPDARRGRHDGASGNAGGMRDGPPPLVPPFIRLSGEQEAKLSELRNAHEPALRARMNDLRDAHAQLHALAVAQAYDEQRAREIVARAEQASGELASMHARLQDAAWLLLTPEQRRRIDRCRTGTHGAARMECGSPA